MWSELAPPPKSKKVCVSKFVHYASAQAETLPEDALYVLGLYAACRTVSPSELTDENYKVGQTLTLPV